VSDLDASAIAAALAALDPAAPNRPLSVAASTGSTNDDARRAAHAGAPHGAAFLADAQTQGRGRGGHRWHSPPGANLYLSLVLRPRIPAAAVAPITLALGLAVAAVVERALRCAAAPPAEVKIKWPNDVIAGDRKLAGVLVEGQLRGDAVQSLIAGVGLNVHTRHFPAELEHRATSLALLGCAGARREVLAAELLLALEEACARYEARRLAPFADDLARRDWLRGRRVSAGEAIGIAAGVDEEGRLLLCGDDGAVRSVVAGEVTVL
jgi:BirA family biotin operon repressor/biotin-[acetyl-CoA-carboxylase] ligase